MKKTRKTILSRDIVRPGDWIIIAIQMPTELEDSESCHKEILVEDFLRSGGVNWNFKIKEIKRREK